MDPHIRRGSSGRRKAKKEKQQRMNIEAATSQCMQMLRTHGYDIKTPDQLPKFLHYILQGGNDGSIAIAQPQTASAPPLALQPDHQAPAPPPQVTRTEVKVTVELAAPPAEWDIDGFEEEEPVHVEVLLREPEFIEEVDEEMLERYEQGQQKMLDRVATQGVRYKYNEGPATGKRMDVHPSMAKRRRVPNLSEPDGAVTMDDINDFDADDVAPGGSRVNSKTGLSLDQQREIVGRALGHTPEKPKGGRPNTIK